MLEVGSRKNIQRRIVVLCRCVRKFVIFEGRPPYLIFHVNQRAFSYQIARHAKISRFARTVQRRDIILARESVQVRVKFFLHCCQPYLRCWHLPPFVWGIWLYLNILALRQDGEVCFPPSYRCEIMPQERKCRCCSLGPWYSRQRENELILWWILNRRPSTPG